MENNDFKHKKNKIELNEEILREIQKRIIIEICSTIPTILALFTTSSQQAQCYFGLCYRA